MFEFQLNLFLVSSFVLPDGSFIRGRTRDGKIDHNVNNLVLTARIRGRDNSAMNNELRLVGHNEIYALAQAILGVRGEKIPGILIYVLKASYISKWSISEVFLITSLHGPFSPR